MLGVVLGTLEAEGLSGQSDASAQLSDDLISCRLWWSRDLNVKDGAHELVQTIGGQVSTAATPSLGSQEAPRKGPRRCCISVPWRPPHDQLSPTQTTTGNSRPKIQAEDLVDEWGFLTMRKEGKK